MPVVQVQDVSKAYRLGSSRTSLREMLAAQARRLFGLASAQQGDPIFWALKDVSFEVQPGEVLGIIGHNGAGKSTLLKLLSNVTYPTCGKLHTQGRTAALIELGAGFHPDLTGRENVYLNGSLLGLKKREIQTLFAEIVAFSGLEKFIDTPVKRYSSGMYVRLAFSVAAHIRADLLLVDEVLSVGDSAFQQKCIDKMNEMHRKGTTILFVSHDLWTVQTFCSRVLLLRKGQVEMSGAPQQVIDAYRRYEREDLLSQGFDAGLDHSEDGLDGTLISQIELLDQDRRPTEVIDSYAKLYVRIHYLAPERLDKPVLVVRFRRPDGLVVCSFHNRSAPGFSSSSIEGPGVIESCVGPLPLVPDIYVVEALLVDHARPIIYANRSGRFFRVRGSLSSSADTGVFVPEVEWMEPEGEG